jgi:hypothetical protein
VVEKNLELVMTNRMNLRCRNRLTNVKDARSLLYKFSDVKFALAAH